MREHLVDWLRRREPGALPQVRVNAMTAAVASGGVRDLGSHDSDARVFGESVDGEERVQTFEGN